ncbi:translation initiation factor IF-2 [Candidatus Bipolaricaulota bacterium]|nr:translation initiation factor IF-2 [Candidatus Bipolaricaulota bacterium]
MSKHRIYEIADELDLESKEILDILDELGMGELTPLNTVDDEEYGLILELYEERKDELSEETEEVAEEEEETVEEETVTEKEEKVEEEVEEEAPRRPAVVSVLGHIDHGKTTLLDTIREARVANSEAGGITQSIGAYQIDWEGEEFTFIDTPGHKAFTSMRSRGAHATDIAILVIAADDGIMDQTREAISHIEAADIPLIVAINKIDKNNANPQETMNQLAREGFTPDDWGGDTIMVQVSALTGENVEELLDMLSLVSEMEAPTGDPEGELKGFIVESHLDSQMGPMATAVIQEGTLRPRDILVVGNTHGRVRALSDESGQIEEAGPSKPVEILGLKDVPPAGASIEAYDDLSKAKKLAQTRKEKQKQKSRKAKPSVEDLFAKAEKDNLDLVLKASSRGSLDAVKKELGEIEVEDIEIEVLHEGIGDISESDIMLASSSENYSAVLGFDVKLRTKAEEQADQLDIPAETYNIIYDLVDNVKRAIGEVKGPQYEEVKIGELEVRQVFDITGSGQIAGCYVSSGKITNKSIIKVWRDSELIHEGQIESLKRFKEDVKEVGEDYECGVSIKDFEGFEEGDTLEAYTKNRVEAF